MFDSQDDFTCYPEISCKICTFSLKICTAWIHPWKKH